MTFYSKKTLQKLYDLDLYTYLITYEPDEIFYVGGNTYATKTHDSLRISNGLWYWFSQGIGGKSVIDYLKLVRGYKFIDAVEFLLDKMKEKDPQYENVNKLKKVNSNKKLILPQKNIDNCRAFNYLSNRGIDSDLIKELIDDGFIYEDNKYHNVVFLGYDKYNNPKYASLRSTNGNYKGDAYGSDKSFSFKIVCNDDSKYLHVFESAIDLLSYITLLKINGKDWRKANYLSLAGVYKPSVSSNEIKVPKVLEMFLSQYKYTTCIFLHLDNDQVGKDASIGLQKSLINKYIVYDNPPSIGKDFNDYLLLQLKNVKDNYREKSR